MSKSSETPGFETVMFSVELTLWTLGGVSSGEEVSGGGFLVAVDSTST